MSQQVHQKERRPQIQKESQIINESGVQLEQYIEQNWGEYLEAFQSALKSSVAAIQERFHLDPAFNTHAKHFWFEYLRVYQENELPLLGFFTTQRTIASTQISVHNPTPSAPTKFSHTLQSRHKQKCQAIHKQALATITTTAPLEGTQEEEEDQKNENKITESAIPHVATKISRDSQNFHAFVDYHLPSELKFAVNILKEKEKMDEEARSKMNENNKDQIDIDFFNYFDTTTKLTQFSEPKPKTRRQERVEQPPPSQIWQPSTTTSRITIQGDSTPTYQQTPQRQNLSDTNNISSPETDHLTKLRTRAQRLILNDETDIIQREDCGDNEDENDYFQKGAKKGQSKRTNQKQLRQNKKRINQPTSQELIDDVEYIESEKVNSKKRKVIVKERMNYIEMGQGSEKTYFTNILERPKNDVEIMYSEFRSGYLHMLFLQEPEESVLKRIKKLKETSKTFSITKVFMRREIHKRNLQFAQSFHKSDIINLIWAYDWAQYICANSILDFDENNNNNNNNKFDYQSHSFLSNNPFIDQKDSSIMTQTPEFPIVSEFNLKDSESGFSQLFEFLQRVAIVLESEIKVQNEIRVQYKMEQLRQKKQQKTKQKSMKVNRIYASYSQDSSICNEEKLNNFNSQNVLSQPALNIVKEYVKQSQSSCQSQQSQGINSQNNYENLLNTSSFSQFDKQLQNKSVNCTPYQSQDSNKSTYKQVFNLKFDQLTILQIIVNQIISERTTLESRMNQTSMSLIISQPSSQLSNKTHDNNTINSQISQPNISQASQEAVAETQFPQQISSIHLIPLEYNLIPTIIYLALLSIGESYRASDIHEWMKSGIFAYNRGIESHLRIENAKLNWLIPPSIPSSDFIQLNARRFAIMIGHRISITKKSFFAQCLRLVSELRLPVIWSAMMYLIGIKGFFNSNYEENTTMNNEDKGKEKENRFHRKEELRREEEKEKEVEEKKRNNNKNDRFNKLNQEKNENDGYCGCEIKASAALVVLLKIIYGLNDEMFAVLLTDDIIQDAKDILDENQYRFLTTIAKHLKNTHFLNVMQFYTGAPTFKQIAQRIADSNQAMNLRMRSQISELHGYKQLQNISSSTMLTVIESFTEQQMQNQTKSKQRKSEIIENPVRIIQEMHSHIELNKQQTRNIDEDGGEEDQECEDQFNNKEYVSVQKKYLFKTKDEQNPQKEKKRQFAGGFAEDLEYMAGEVISKGKAVIPPCFDYELERKPISGGKGLSKEMDFLVGQLSQHIGLESKQERLLDCLYKLERSIHQALEADKRKDQ